MTAFDMLRGKAGRFDETLGRPADASVAVDAPQPVGGMRLEIVEQEVDGFLGLLEGGRVEMPPDIVRAVHRREALQGGNTADQYEGRFRGPHVGAGEEAKGGAAPDKERVAQRSLRIARMQQGADAKDRGGHYAEKEQMFGSARCNQRPENEAPDAAAHPSVAEDAGVFCSAIRLAGCAPGFANAEQDEDGAGVTPDENQRHYLLGPEGEGEHGGVEQAVRSRKRGEAMKTFAAREAYGLAVFGRDIDLAQEHDFQISQLHACVRRNGRTFPWLEEDWQNIVDFSQTRPG